MARKKAAEHENHERWLISYADFITLLFAFFVVMFASSQTDKSKVQQVADSVKEALQNGATKPIVRVVLGGTVDDTGKGNAMMKGPGGAQKRVVPKLEIAPAKVTVTNLMPSMKFLNEALSTEIKQGKVEMHLEARGLVISLREGAFFASGGNEIAPSAFGTVEHIAKTIRALPNGVRLEGHTDSIPIHNGHFRSNWELSAARAIAMMELLATRYDIPRERFGVAGYAENLPVDTNETPEGRAHNRRVDLVVLNQQLVVQTEPEAQTGAAPARPAK